MTSPVIGLLVVSHGRLAAELVNAVRTIVGEVGALEAVSIEWEHDPDESLRAIERGIGAVDRGQGVLVLTDMFGGTPTNLAMSLHEAGRIEIVTGVNLPMLLKATGMRGRLDLHETAGRLAVQARDAIQVATELLESPESGGSREGES